VQQFYQYREVYPLCADISITNTFYNRDSSATRSRFRFENASGGGSPRSMLKHPPLCIYRLLGYLPTPVRKLLYRVAVRRVTLGVSAVIIDDARQVLLARHTYRRPAWDFPSGIVGANEQPATAVVRELREELGVDATIGTLLHAENHRGMHHLTLYYRVFIVGQPHGSSPEIDDWRYVPLANLPEFTGQRAPSWLCQLLDPAR
jgi:8-oxo-dGTP pyrophosphatase MutT (NUDIX family)